MMSISSVGHLILLIVAIICAQNIFAMAEQAAFSRWNDPLPQTGGFVCHACNESRQCRTKQCHYGKCVDNRRDFRICTRNSLRECADCRKNEDCVYGICKAKICAHDHDALKRCQNLLQYEQKLKQSLGMSHMDFIGDDLINFEDLESFNAYGDMAGVKISLADVEAAEKKERWEKLTVKGTSVWEISGEKAFKEEMRDAGYSMRDGELILGGFGTSDGSSFDSNEDIVEKGSGLMEQFDIHGLSLVPDYSDHLGDAFDFDMDQFEVIDEHIEDNIHSFL